MIAAYHRIISPAQRVESVFGSGSRCQRGTRGLSCCFHVNSQYQVRGHRTGSSHFGVEEYPRKKKQNECRYTHMVINILKVRTYYEYLQFQSHRTLSRTDAYTGVRTFFVSKIWGKGGWGGGA